MTDRAEIERMLQMTGRTLEGLSKDIGYLCSAEYLYDLVDLLVGALRDALDKPMQKPLTLEELGQLDPDIYIWEERRAVTRSYFSKSPGIVLSMILKTNKDDDFYRYGHQIRAWKKMPTDEEMEAVPWMD